MHGLVVTSYALWVAGLPEPEPVVAVPVGVGVPGPVGDGVVGTVVGVLLGVDVGSGTVGVAEGITGAMGTGVVGPGVGMGLAWVEHVELGDATGVDFPLPPGLVGTPAPPGKGWPVPLLLAPPAPPPDPVPPDEDEVMLEIACLRPGTATAVPANSKTAATARMGRSQAVPKRW